jgi:outer membrane protein OmpA-like peptidoglycan-associated protein/Tol biopolymer transport system component/uncharacterized protein YegL
LNKQLSLLNLFKLDRLFRHQFIVITSFVFAQYSYAQPGEMKLIKKQKFEKIESILTKEFSKNPNSCHANYVQGILFNSKAYSKFNPEVAYSSFNTALSNYYMLDEKERSKCDKEGILPDSILRHRNESCDFGLEIAQKVYTIESFQHFIDVFKDAGDQMKVAILRRDELAFIAATTANTEEAYIGFLEKYPSAVQRPDAIVLRDERAFEKAKLIERSSAIIEFLTKYPNTHLKKDAEFEKNKLLFKEQTDGTIAGYIRFCSKNEASEFYDQAMDSITSISIAMRDITGLKYLVTHSDKLRNYSAFQDNLMNLYLFDGCLNTYNYFRKEFSYYLDRSHKTSLDEFGNSLTQVDKLFLKIGVSDYNLNDYEDFIRQMAPNDIAFVALQRLIEFPFKTKNWTEALTQLKRFEQLFSVNQQNKVSDLIQLLNHQETTVQIQAVKGINTMTDEYAPVPSIDGKKLYFCGKDRKDNYGGEDIFIATNQKQQFITSGIVPSLSTYDGNEAPLSVSADGNSMFLWSNENGGDIKITRLQKDGTWSNPESLPDPINTAYYEGDAMLSADGKTLVFVSSRPGGLNIYTDNTLAYHGDDNYPTDIYVCHLSSDGTWSEPLNLGETINTPYSERGPYIHPDGKTLYFSSDGHTGLGRMDVFKTSLVEEDNFQSWTKPINLGKEINTTGNDWGFKFSTDGKHVFYAAKNQSVAPSSLVLLLDVSGSMDGSKIVAMREAAKEVCLNALENNTEVAIFAFEGDCYEPITDYRDFTTDALDLTDFIANLEPLGATPMYEALYTATYYLKNSASVSSKNKSIILMSDGDATSCFSMDQLMKEMKTNKLFNRVYTIALEVDEYSKAYEDLQFIAQKTGGEFFHAETSNDLGNAFAQASNKIFNFSLRQSNSDVFEFVLPLELRPQVVSTISGTIVDANKKPIEANILWEDLNTGEQIGQARSNPVDGSYFIVLPTGKNYGYFVDHPSYFPASNNVDLRNKETMEDISVNVDVVSYDEMINNQKSVKINNLFFETAKYDLKAESYNELNRIAEILKRAKMEGLKIEISGHTDNVGEADYNAALSEFRARSVADYLISKGVDESMLVVKGYGFAKPVADNATEANRALNRRVELKLIK